MSRTIKDIYNAAVAERNKRLELSEFKSDSKMSVMNGILWVVAAVIYSFETLLDVFAVDITAATTQRMPFITDIFESLLNSESSRRLLRSATAALYISFIVLLIQNTPYR